MNYVIKIYGAISYKYILCDSLSYMRENDPTITNQSHLGSKDDPWLMVSICCEITN
jgi:hypothetical protein